MKNCTVQEVAQAIVEIMNMDEHWVTRDRTSGLIQNAAEIVGIGLHGLQKIRYDQTERRRTPTADALVVNDLVPESVGWDEFLSLIGPHVKDGQQISADFRDVRALIGARYVVCSGMPIVEHRRIDLMVSNGFDGRLSEEAAPDRIFTFRRITLIDRPRAIIVLANENGDA